MSPEDHLKEAAADIELASPEAFSDFLEAPRRARSLHRLRGEAFGSPARPVRPRRCNCGKCAGCLENARWDKIFNEKFADPDYYAPRTPQLGSSLGELA